MLPMAKKRIWPSFNCNAWLHMRRHALGESSGKSPSITSTKASASQNVSLLKTYFLAYFLAGATAEPPPRNTLKNSDDAGSSTMTSLLLLKLAL
jgi:hypothetical protein